MASTTIKSIKKYDIDSLIASLKELTNRYPQDDALKQSLMQYETIRSVKQ